eukprot:5738821-Amphidinium_carterae.1
MEFERTEFPDIVTMWATEAEAVGVVNGFADSVWFKKCVCHPSVKEVVRPIHIASMLLSIYAVNTLLTVCS